MLMIEFRKNFTYGGLNILRYRDIDGGCSWNYLFIDLETLTLLLANFSIPFNDNRLFVDGFNVDYDIPILTIPEKIKVDYCGAEIELKCNDNIFSTITNTKLQQEKTNKNICLKCRNIIV
jgi:hypothetical protein